MSFSIISLTDIAAERLHFIVANANEPVIGVRLSIRNGGCAGMSYELEYVQKVTKGDDLVESHGLNIYIDPKAVLFLLGTKMDYQTERFSSGFVFKNPNETAACGCGESVSITPVDPEKLSLLGNKHSFE